MTCFPRSWFVWNGRSEVAVTEVHIPPARWSLSDEAESLFSVTTAVR